MIKRMEDFDFGSVKGMGKSEAVNLLDFRWIDNKENILFFGPPGVGKTHRSIVNRLRCIGCGKRL
jgi:DNA replication protein DnaC